MKLTKPLAFLGLAWLLPGCMNSPTNRESASRPLAETTAVVAAIDAIAETALATHQIPGLSIALWQGGEEILAKGYGLANRDLERPATAETIYPIGSISKHFTAAAIMKLVEAGKIDLEASIDTYLPDYPRHHPPLRVHHLLRQTSGLPEVLELAGIAEIEQGDAQRYPLASVIDLFKDEPLRFAAGSRWAYSNSNYSLAAALIERVSGQTHDAFLHSSVLQPIGLKATRACHHQTSPESEHAAGYTVSADGTLAQAGLGPNPAPYTGNGGLCSNATELARWLRLLVAEQVVSDRSFARMTKLAPVTAGYTPLYGFGLSTVHMAGRPSLGHTGATDGFTSAMAFFPEDDLTIVLLTNKRHVWITELLKPMARAALSLPDPTIEDRWLSRDVLNAYIGVYDDGLFELELFIEKDHLHLHTEPLGPPQKLLYQGNHTFVAADAPDTFRLTFEIEVGQATRLVFEWLELQSFANRVS